MADVPAKLEPLLEPIGAIHESPRNPRTGHDIDGIVRSIAELGWHAPIVATRDGEVIVGNGRLAAARRLGLDTVPVLRVDDDGVTAIRRMVADNRLTELSTWDIEQLALLADELGDWEHDLRIDEVLEGLGSYDIDPIVPPVLPGGDRSPFQQMTFTLHDDQVEMVREALKRALADGATSNVSENTNGNALTHICSEYLCRG